MLTKKGLLYPDSGTLVQQLTPDTSEVANLYESWSCRVGGAMQQALWAALEAGDQQLPPALAALGEEHPLTRTARRLTQQAPRPLSLAQAAQLDGFDTLFVELTGQCNERCVHCYAGSHPQLVERLDQHSCERLLDDAAALGFQRVQFTGGDPLLCPFLPELTEQVSRLGIPLCEIYTNGLLLHEPLLARLQPFRPTFAFSFYSSDADVHDAVTRTPGSQQRTARAIRHVVEAGLGLRVAVIVMEQNATTVDQTVDYLRQLGVRQIGVTGTRAVGRGDRYQGTLGTSSPREHWPRSKATANATPSRSGKLCVTYEGLVVPCIFNRQDVLGDLGHRSLAEIVAEPRPPAADSKTGDELISHCCDRLQCKSCQLTAYALRAAASPG